MQGWGKRQYNWEFSAGVQQEIAPRIAGTFSYFGRRYGNFIVTDDLNVSAADFDYFSVAVPDDPRLPTAGQTIGNFPNVRVLKPQNNMVTFASNYGEQYRRWNGVDATIDARVRNGLMFQGGVSTGKETTDNCEVVRRCRRRLPAASSSRSITATANSPIRRTSRGSAPIRCPGGGCRSAAHSRARRRPGPERPRASSIGGMQANVTYPNAVIAPSLGRPLSTGPPRSSTCSSSGSSTTTG